MAVLRGHMEYQGLNLGWLHTMQAPNHLYYHSSPQIMHFVPSNKDLSSNSNNISEVWQTSWKECKCPLLFCPLLFNPVGKFIPKL